MKKILLLIGMIAIGLTSCNKLDELSDNRVEQIDTPEKIKNILTSAYPKTTNTYITELASDNIADNGANVPGIPFFAIEAAYWKPIGILMDFIIFGNIIMNLSPWPMKPYKRSKS